MGRGQIPAIAFCAEKQRLLNEFTQAMRELLALQSQQIQAVIAGAPDFEQFESLIHAASEKKRQVKYAYMEHVQVHGC
jgi:hypothetical protein